MNPPNTGTTILAIVALIAALIFIKNIPELRRYLRISSM